MTKGMIKLGDSVIHLYDVNETQTSVHKAWAWTGYVEGGNGYIYTFFSYEGWRFTPERKPLAEQINELAAGTLFYINPDKFRYIKVDENILVRLWDVDNGLVAGTFEASAVARQNDYGHEYVTVLDWSEFND